MQKQGRQVAAQLSLPETCSRAAEGNEPQKHLQSEQQKEPTEDLDPGAWNMDKQGDLSGTQQRCSWMPELLLRGTLQALWRERNHLSKSRCGGLYCVTLAELGLRLPEFPSLLVSGVRMSTGEICRQRGRC